jgi:hypothetical protein
MKPLLRLNYNRTKLRICVDGIDGGAVNGRVFSQRLKEPFVFTDLSNLVLRLDRLMDEQNYPQAFQRKRTFMTAAPASKKNRDETAREDDDRPYLDAETVEGAAGKKATFELQVLSRQNTNWQGFVDFLDGAGRREFESDLEFFAMVNETLNIVKWQRYFLSS